MGRSVGEKGDPGQMTSKEAGQLEDSSPVESRMLTGWYPPFFATHIFIC